MSASKKLIKDCSECVKELQIYLKNCGDWEVKKKKILEEAKDKICDANWAKNKPHSAVVSQEVDKHRIDKRKITDGGNSWWCHECSIKGLWEKNDFGDFRWEGHVCKHTQLSIKEKEYLEKQGINIPKIGESIQTQTNQSANQIKSNQIHSSVSQNSNKTNYLPWILGGVGLVSLVGILAYFVLKNKKGGE